LREEKGMSQRQLAMYAGISNATISRIEKIPDKKPDSDTIIKIASALGVDPSFFFSGDEQQKKPIEADVPDELLNSPIKLEALTAFSSLSPEDQQFFLDMMRARGKT